MEQLYELLGNVDRPAPPIKHHLHYENYSEAEAKEKTSQLNAVWEQHYEELHELHSEKEDMSCRIEELQLKLETLEQMYGIDGDEAFNEYVEAAYDDYLETQNFEIDEEFN